MPSVDIVDLNNEKVGSLELADEVFGAEVNEALLYEAVRHYQAGDAARHAQDQDAPRSVRLRQEAVEAEGHRPRAHGFDPVAAVAARRHGARTATARLQLQTAAQDAAGRAALGAFGQAARRRVESGAGLSIWPITRPRAHARSAGQAGSAARRCCWSITARTAIWRWRVAQSEGRDAGADQGRQRLRSAGPPGGAAESKPPRKKLSEALAK